MAADPFHLAWFLNGYKVHTWKDQFVGPGGADLNSREFYIDFARSLERAGFDYVLLEDSSFVPDAYGDSREIYLKDAIMVPKMDPAVLATILSEHTSRLGIVPTLSTSEYPPYLLARMTATLDHVSRGRGGWNVVTGSSDRAAQNYGRDRLPDHSERYAIADEFADVVTQLWGSWEADAVVEDRDANVYVDHTKVHSVDFEGTYFRSRGPLNMPRPPQGRPVIAQAGGSPAGRNFASKWADTIIGYSTTPEQMKEYRDDVRARMPGHGRKPDDCKVLFLISVMLGATDEEAEQRVRDRRAEVIAHPERELANMGFVTNIDFSVFDFDAPLMSQPDLLKTNGHKSVLDSLIARAGDLPLRELIAQREAFEVVGSPETAAAKLDEVMQEVGGDGFLFTIDQMTRRTVTEVTEGLVPALQRRGLVRRGYTHEQFRDNLFEF